jgi:trans-L-3-hydroxyproline dehydratase
MNLDWTTRPLMKDGKTVITAIDTHAAGEPLRILTGGLPPLPGDSILDRRRWMRDNLDHLRRALLWEPRGHFDTYGCVPTPPVTPGADLGVLFLHNEGYSTMCGHGVIALVTALVETGAVRPGWRSFTVWENVLGPLALRLIHRNLSPIGSRSRG